MAAVGAGTGTRTGARACTRSTERSRGRDRARDRAAASPRPPHQVVFGLVIAAREVLYLATTLGGALACPAYLLLDVATTWHEAESRRQGGFRGAREGGDGARPAAALAPP